MKHNELSFLPAIPTHTDGWTENIARGGQLCLKLEETRQVNQSKTLRSEKEIV